MPEEELIPNPETPVREVLPESPLEMEKAPETLVEAEKMKAFKENNEKYGKILSAVKTVNPSSSSPVAVADDAKAMGPLQDAQHTIKKLVILAETKSVIHAVAVAKKLNELYVLDSLHDTLADDLSDALAEKGLIRGE